MYNLRILSIEGNIGAGKSTLLATLQKRYQDREDVLFILEPVDIWETVKDEYGQNMLQKFYSDPRSYSFAFQVMAFSTRLKLIRTMIEQTEELRESKIVTIVMERSLDADRAIFAQMLYDDKLMDKCEFEIYNRMAEDSLAYYRSDGIMWLTVEPEICYERVVSRAREGEQTITLDYLQKCDVYHKQWLGADLGFVKQLEDSQSDDPQFWESMDQYILGT
jgi:deoxyadenosine/deoxycytidine kinase